MEDRKKPYNIDDVSRLENLGWESMSQLLDQHMPIEKPSDKKVIPLYWKWMAAAVILVMLGTGWYLWQNEKTEPSSNLVNHSKTKENENPNLTLPKDKNSDSNIHTQGNVAKNDHDDIHINKANASNGTSSNSIRSKDADNQSFAKNDNALQKRFSDNTVTSIDANRKNQMAFSSRKLEKNALISSSSSENLTAFIFIPKVENEKSQIGNNAIADISKSSKEKAENALAQNNTNSLEELNNGNTSSFRARMNKAIKEDTTKNDNSAIAKKEETPKYDSAQMALNRKKMEELFHESETQNIKENKDRNLQLALLLNRNVTEKNVQSGNQLYDLPLYPSVSATVKITKKVGISSGISISSPGNLTSASQSSASYATSAFTSANAVSAGVVKQPVDAFNAVNNSTGTLNLTSDNYAGAVRQAYYWQIPVMIDFFPINHLKLSAGTDLSFVQKVLVADGTSGNGTLQNFSTFNSQNAYSQVRGFDPRLSFGAQYQLKKVMIGAKFSRSFQSALQYNNGYLPSQNNQIFNFSIGYRLFQ